MKMRVVFKGQDLSIREFIRYVFDSAARRIAKVFRFGRRKILFYHSLPQQKKYHRYLQTLFACLNVPTSHIGRVVWHYVMNYRPRTIVELGTGASLEMRWNEHPFKVFDRRNSGAYLARIIALACYELDMKEGIQSHLYTFDIEPERNLRVEELFKKLDLSKYVTSISGRDCLDAVKEWNKPIDLLINDSSHTYEQTIKELREWGKFLKVGGILMMHDVGVEPVVKAKDEYLKEHKFELLFMIPQWAGAWRKL